MMKRRKKTEMKEKTPLIRLAKREDMARNRIWMIRFAALVFAIILGGMIFVIAGSDPITAYGAMISGTLETSNPPTASAPIMPGSRHLLLLRSHLICVGSL